MVCLGITKLVYFNFNKEIFGFKKKIKVFLENFTIYFHRFIIGNKSCVDWIFLIYYLIFVNSQQKTIKKRIVIEGIGYILD